MFYVWCGSKPWGASISLGISVEVAQRPPPCTLLQGPSVPTLVLGKCCTQETLAVPCEREQGSARWRNERGMASCSGTELSPHPAGPGAALSTLNSICAAYGGHSHVRSYTQTWGSCELALSGKTDSCSPGQPLLATLASATESTFLTTPFIAAERKAQGTVMVQRRCVCVFI